MKVSFIVIARSREEIEIDTSRLLGFDKSSISELEVVCAYGLGPSRQRNEAAKLAKGDWLYLIDNDSLVDDLSIDKFIEALKIYPDAVVVGGPSVVSESKNDWQRAIQIVFSSDVGIGPIKSRYASIGRIRKTTDKELILCNLLIKKEVFEQMGGFNESLYPNEENEFLARLKKFGTVVYSPEVIVYRRHRNTMSEFFTQMYSYGKGRTRHLLFSKNYNDYIYFMPLVFAFLVLISLLKIKIFFVFMSIYFLIITPTIIINWGEGLEKNFIAKLYLAFVLCHSGYALGLLGGFFEKKLRNITMVETEIFK